MSDKVVYRQIVDTVFWTHWILYFVFFSSCTLRHLSLLLDIQSDFVHVPRSGSQLMSIPM